MPQSILSEMRAKIGSLIVIAVIVGASAAAFAYTAGWLTPGRLTPVKVVDALAPPGGPALGHRRNHAKGICFTGAFQSNGAGASLSTATAFAAGHYPVIGRFNLAIASPDAADVTARVRGMGLQIATPNGQVWRSAMITAPIFPVSTPQDFYDLLRASGSKDPNAMKTFVAANPEFGNFVQWATTAPWTSSYAEDRFNSLDSFIFVDGSGQHQVVRWSLIPIASLVPISPGDLAKRGPNYLESEIADRVGKAPQSWTLAVTVANAGDQTDDPSKAWPADRRTIAVGTLVVQQVEPEANGPCRDINFDPTVLPAGMMTSNDPFPAARSAAYAVSYDRRTAEAADYPRTATGGTP
ncbi:catalase family peroxidase [Acidisoma cellulosilytica]|uniref:Catalase-related peroxidase n=1 Tax=Acidisoma cellulosilyticum TaxID=2802395 RepID=A0A963Z0K8_9PROT|nr:catalase family peroxidase [Acidisoma cellulosilyticum]MCB8880657.1 catalase family peroxidase [Acidisoma cellulosilyticum]